MIDFAWKETLSHMKNVNTVDSHNLKVEGILWNTSRYPHFDISDLQSEENTSRTTKFYKWTCNLTLLVRNIYWKYCGKGGEIAPEEQFLLLPTVFCYLMLDFFVKTRIRFSLRDKQLFEITKVEITRVDCTQNHFHIHSAFSELSLLPSSTSCEVLSCFMANIYRLILFIPQMSITVIYVVVGHMYGSNYVSLKVFNNSYWLILNCYMCFPHNHRLSDSPPFSLAP